MGRLELISMNIPSEAARNIEAAFDERSVDHEFGLVVRDWAGAPGFDLLAERFEIALGPRAIAHAYSVFATGLESSVPYKSL